MKKDKLTIIDLDSMTYIVASKQFTAGNTTNTEEVRAHIRRFIDTLILRTEADYYILVYQSERHSNFRKYYYPDYKSNRGEKPEFLELWGFTILEVYKELEATEVKAIESDDALAIAKKLFDEKYDITLAHADKDMYQVPGKHWYFRGKVEEAFSEIDEKQAYLNWAKQMLTGDSTDGILGCAIKVDKVWKSGDRKGQAYQAREGIGPQKALELLAETGSTRDVIAILHSEYQKMFGNDWYSNYLKTYKLITLLKDTPNDIACMTDKHLDFKIEKNTITTPNSLFNDGEDTK